jgi:hypothetical protein
VEQTRLRAGVPPLAVAGVAGGVWGLLGYALLWGHTPFFIHRPFVVSLPGTLLLLPVRIVLWGIHVVEGVAGHPFDFSRRNGWIGALAAAVGAGLAVAVAAAVRFGLRRIRRGD